MVASIHSIINLPLMETKSRKEYLHIRNKCFSLIIEDNKINKNISWFEKKVDSKCVPPYMYTEKCFFVLLVFHILEIIFLFSCFFIKCIHICPEFSIFWTHCFGYLRLILMVIYQTVKTVLWLGPVGLVEVLSDRWKLFNSYFWNFFIQNPV